MQVLKTKTIPIKIKAFPFNITRSERGWGGHFICAYKCQFRRNTLVKCAKVRIVVSTVGLMLMNIDEDDPKKRFDAIGIGRYFETMVFHAHWEQEDKYQDANVQKQITLAGPWAIDKIDGELEADIMHEAAVKEIIGRIKMGEFKCKS